MKTPRRIGIALTLATLLLALLVLIVLPSRQPQGVCVLDRRLRVVGCYGFTNQIFAYRVGWQMEMGNFAPGYNCLALVFTWKGDAPQALELIDASGQHHSVTHSTQRRFLAVGPRFQTALWVFPVASQAPYYIYSPALKANLAQVNPRWQRDEHPPLDWQ